MSIFKSETEADLYESCHQRNARLARFVRSVWPDLMEAEPPKTEPAIPQPGLQIDNPYVPLAKSRLKHL